MYTVGRSLTSENILRLISEEDIFRHYMGQDYVMGLTNSPIRLGDSNPSFSVFISKHSKYTLRFKDWGTGKSGSCFDLVMLKYNLTYWECLEVINNDFNLGLEGRIEKNMKVVETTFKFKETIPVADEKVVIQITSRPFYPSDLAYWRQFNIHKETLATYNVVAVKYYWIIKGEKRRYVRSSIKSPIYAYCFPNNEYKLYAPFRTDKYKWISNTKQLTIQGLFQTIERPNEIGIPVKNENSLRLLDLSAGPIHPNEKSALNSRLLIITKSLKDVMSLSSFGIKAVAPMAESIILQPEHIHLLRNHFGVILSLMDFDHAGVRNANTLRHNYGIEALFLTNGRFGSKNYGSKDFSDYIKNNGVSKTLELLRTLGLKFT